MTSLDKEECHQKTKKLWKAISALDFGPFYCQKILLNFGSLTVSRAGSPFRSYQQHSGDTWTVSHRSTNQLNVAWLQWSYENWYFQVDTSLRPNWDNFVSFYWHKIFFYKYVKLYAEGNENKLLFSFSSNFEVYFLLLFCSAKREIRK